MYPPLPTLRPSNANVLITARQSIHHLISQHRSIFRTQTRTLSDCLPHSKATAEADIFLFLFHNILERRPHIGRRLPTEYERVADCRRQPLKKQTRTSSPFGLSCSLWTVVSISVGVHQAEVVDTVGKNLVTHIPSFLPGRQSIFVHHPAVSLRLYRCTHGGLRTRVNGPVAVLAYCISSGWAPPGIARWEWAAGVAVSSEVTAAGQQEDAESSSCRYILDTTADLGHLKQSLHYRTRPRHHTAQPTPPPEHHHDHWPSGLSPE